MFNTETATQDVIGNFVNSAGETIGEFRGKLHVHGRTANGHGAGNYEPTGEGDIRLIVEGLPTLVLDVCHLRFGVAAFTAHIDEPLKALPSATDLELLRGHDEHRPSENDSPITFLADPPKAVEAIERGEVCLGRPRAMGILRADEEAPGLHQRALHGRHRSGHHRRSGATLPADLRQRLRPRARAAAGGLSQRVSARSSAEPACGCRTRPKPSSFARCHPTSTCHSGVPDTFVSLFLTDNSSLISLRAAVGGPTVRISLGVQLNSSFARRAARLHLASAVSRALSGSIAPRLEALEPRRLFTGEPHVLGGEFLYDTKPHRLQIQFDQDVSASLSVGDLYVHKYGLDTTRLNPSTFILDSYDHNSNKATFRYTGNASTGLFADGHYRATLYSEDVLNTAAQPLASSWSFDFSFKKGDVNRDLRTNAIDYDYVANALDGHPSGVPNARFSEGDVNYDGTVDGDDLDLAADEDNYGALGTLEKAGTTLSVFRKADGSRTLEWANDCAFAVGYRI